MTPSENRTKSLAEAQAAIKELVALNAKDYSRAQELGPAINFEGAVEDIDTILQYFRDLNNRSLERLSRDHLEKIKSEAKIVKDLLLQITNFSIAVGNPTDAVNTIVTAIANQRDKTVQSLALLLAFTATQATDYSKLEREAKGLVSRIEEQAAAFDARLSDSSQRAKVALEELQKQVAEGGISQNAQYFKDAADEEESASKKWRIATIWMMIATGVLTGGAAFSAYFYHPAEVSIAIQIIAAKILVISVASFSTIWCAKNYRSRKHNVVVNRHRQHALSTFRTFIEGTDSIEVRDAILVAAADAAFSARSTGYDGPESDGFGSAIQAESMLRLASRSLGASQTTTPPV